MQIYLSLLDGTKQNKPGERRWRNIGCTAEFDRHLTEALLPEVSIDNGGVEWNGGKVVLWANYMGCL